MMSSGFNDYYHGYILFQMNSCDGTESEPILVYNNTLYAFDNDITSLSGYSIYDCQYLDFYYNNAVIDNDYDIYLNATRGHALSIQSSDHINVKNNILAYKGNGLAYNLQTGGYTNYDIDYNDLYNEGMYLAAIGQDKFKTITELRNNSDYAEHSVKAPPLLGTNLFSSSKFLNGRGTPLTLVTHDIQGTLRDTENPDIGCYEFSPLSPWQPISGTKIIGSNRADYNTISEAINDLLSRGVTGGNVTFDIESGIYDEQINLLYIPRDNFTGYVTIESQTENASDVNIRYNATNNDDNYILNIIGSDNLSINALTFTPLDPSYNKIALINGYNSYLTISHCIFDGVEDANYNNGVLLDFDLASIKSIWISNNEFNNGGYGIYYSNYNYPEYADTFLIDNNTFDNNYQSLYLHSVSSLFIEANNFANQNNIVMNLETINEDISIYKNKAFTTGAKCLELDHYSGDSQTMHRIANNFFNLSATSTKNLVTMTYCDYLDICFNTFEIDDNTAYGKAFYLS